MTHNQHYNLYVASCTVDGGIYRYQMNENGSLKLIEKTVLDRPMYMTKDSGKMYIVLREAFENGDSGVISFDIDMEGSLKNPSEIKSTKGKVACHIAVNGDNVFCANYISGSIIKMPDTLIKHNGIGVHPTRQTSPHAHFVGFTPDKKYLCAVDLGIDTIFIYDKDLNLISEANVPMGHGARHIVFSDDGKYMFCANELQSTVSAFSYNDGSFKPIDTASLLPEDYQGESTAVAIRFHNDRIYVSNRGDNSVSEISFKNEKLKLIKTISCKGKSPRDFDFFGNFMICTNEDSNNITVFDCDKNFEYIKSYSLEHPLCIVS